MTRERNFDVVVIGGGVLGSAVAARIALSSASVCLLEAADDVADGASKGNAGIVNSYYAPTGTLEADLIAASWPRWEDLSERLDVPFSRPGALTVALDSEQAAQLPALCDRARAAGATAELLSGDQARELEPLVSAECRGAVHLPDEGVIDPMRLTCAYAELAAANGAEIRRSCPAIGFDGHGELITAVITPEGRLGARWVINAAGIAGAAISALANGEQFRIWPRKGQYWILDRAFGEQLRMIVVRVPTPQTRGVQVSPTTNGSVLLGPDAQDIDDPYDKATERENLLGIFEQAQRLVPSVTLEPVIKTYAANRTASDETVRLRADRLRPNLIHLGNRSTGVSCSPATADRVRELLAAGGLDSADRPDAVRSLRKTRRLLLDPDPESLYALDPRYRQVVCVCEQVTAAEIAQALTARVPARSIEGVRKRTRATAGRCQGSVCMAGVTFLCSLHTGLPPAQIRHGPEPATVGISA